MNRFRGAWENLNFDKEYLFCFETLVFATSGILSMHNQLVTLQRERKTHHMTPLSFSPESKPEKGSVFWQNVNVNVGLL